MTKVSYKTLVVQNDFRGKFFVKNNPYHIYFPPSEIQEEEGGGVPAVIKKYEWGGVNLKVSVFVNGENIDLNTVFSISISYSLNDIIPSMNLKIANKGDINIGIGDKVSVEFTINGETIKYFSGVIDRISFVKNADGDYWDVSIMGRLSKLKNYNLSGSLLAECEAFLGRFYSSGQIISKLFEPFGIPITVPQGIIIKTPYNLNNKTALDLLGEILEYNQWGIVEEGEMIKVFSFPQKLLSSPIARFDSSSYNEVVYEKDLENIINNIVISGEETTYIGYKKSMKHKLAQSVENGKTVVTEEWNTFLGDTLIRQRKIVKAGGKIVKGSTYEAIIEDATKTIKNIFFNTDCSLVTKYISEIRQYFWDLGEDNHYTLSGGEIKYTINPGTWKISKMSSRKFISTYRPLHVFDFPPADSGSVHEERETISWYIQDDYNAIEAKEVFKGENGSLQYVAGWGFEQVWGNTEEEKKINQIEVKDIPSVKVVEPKVERKELIYKYKSQNWINKVGEKKETYNLSVFNSVEELKNFAKWKMKHAFLKGNTVKMNTFFFPFLKVGDVILIDEKKVLVTNINISISYQTNLDTSMDIEGYLF